MEQLQAIISEYARMRANGMSSRDCLRALRIHVDQLTHEAKEQLAQELRVWEETHNPVPPPPSSAGENTPASAAAAGSGDEESTRPPASEAVQEDTDELWVVCRKCSTRNPQTRDTCLQCGTTINQVAERGDTRDLPDPGDIIRPEYFDQQSVLVLTVRGRGDVYRVRPQLRNHAIVIGRSTEGESMVPDVDLAEARALELGVSRMHLAVRYEAESSTLQVYDLGSANGSFINSQRLHPRELRLLRSGDVLHVGRLVLEVEYEHPQSS